MAYAPSPAPPPPRRGRGKCGYDEMDRLTTRKDALNRTEQYEYDKAGNLAKFTDRKNQQATFSYDSLNRRTGATYPDSSVTFGYDAIGRLTSVSDSVGGNITWTYDVVGQHPRVAETTAVGTVTVEYDNIGRRFKLSATGQTDVTYTYDKNSRLKTVTQGSQTVTLAYDDAGRRTSLTYPNGVVSSYGYDNANRLETLSHVKTPTTIEALTYQNDAAGNRTKVTRANAAASLIPTAVSNTAYDAANEQIQFNNPTPNVVYDSNGNLASFTDASGTTTYTWNARNQLTTISGPGLSASFVYDGLGRRTSKTVNSTTTGYWYDGRDILADLSGSTPTATYIRSLSIDEPFIRKGASDEFFQTDALGGSLALTDTTGVAQATYTYESFGKTTITGTSANPFQYTGRENDGTGLYFYRQRYYSSVLQRFLSQDPIGLLGGVNFYRYVLNNPLSFTDPLGLDVTITLYPGAGGFGHIGVGVNTSNTLGLYPASAGDPVTAVVGLVNGTVKPDTRQPSQTPLVIPRSPAQDKAMQAVINQALANPPAYNFLSRLSGKNCATFVKDVLQAGGIQVPNTILPAVLFGVLQQQYGPPELVSGSVGGGGGGMSTGLTPSFLVP